MIFNNNIYLLLLSYAATIILIWRLSSFFNLYFDQTLSNILTLIVLFHPLSIEAILAPNAIAGSLAFLLFIEGLIRIKRNSLNSAMILFLGASICNIGYSLFPIYYYNKHKTKFQNYFPYYFTYLVLLVLFMFVRLLKHTHNPFTFFSYFIHNLIAPISVNIFSYSVFPFSLNIFILSMIIFGVLFYIQVKKKLGMDNLFILILPLIGIFFEPWTEQSFYWQEIIYSPSSYLPITFAFFFILAFFLPKSFFKVFIFVVLYFSIQWTTCFNSFSNIIETSIGNLPTDYSSELKNMKRVLSDAYFFEHRTKDALKVLEFLSLEFPNDPEIKEQILKASKSTH
jgi:hypothetical protein